MELPVKFIYSHDSFRVGEDGPTHEPIEHEAQIRLLEQMDNMHGRPSVLVIRPADGAETVAAYKMASVVKAAENPDVVLVANGSDVALLLHSAEALAAEGINAQVVSMPSVGLFKRQDAEYRNSVIPEDVKIFGLTSGLPSVLYPVMHGEFEVMGLERFGASAPAKVLEDKFGYTIKAGLLLCNVKRIKRFQYLMT